MPLAPRHFMLALIGTFAFASVCSAQDNPSVRWEKDIAKFEQADKENPPRAGGIVFIGSSSIRMWDLKKSFPDRAAVNRGFGGSEIADSIYFAERVLFPHKPRVIVMYAGDNDLSKGKSPETVFADWKTFVAKVHDELPETRIVFVAIKPSIKRWNLIDKVRAANSMIAKHCAGNEQLAFVDIDTPMIGDNGMPRAELFKDDGLHLNDKGYVVWAKLVRPLLK